MLDPRRSSRIVVGLLASLGLTVAGCGGGGDDLFGSSEAVSASAASSASASSSSSSVSASASASGGAGGDQGSGGDGGDPGPGQGGAGGEGRGGSEVGGEGGGKGGMGGAPPSCGNDQKNAGEECDGADLGDSTCGDFGFTNPAGLACTEGCELDAGGCTPVCDGALEPGEICDGADLDGHTCQEFGYASPGGLACSLCALDPSGCAAICGNGVLEPGEECDDQNLVSGDLCSENCTIEGLTCAGAATISIDLGPSVVLQGTTVGGGHHSSSACTAPAADRIYAVTSLSAGFLTGSLSRPGTSFDSLLHVRTDCGSPSSQLLCADSYDPNLSQTLTGGEVVSFPLQAGETVFLFVDGIVDEGDYTLELDLSDGNSCFDPVPIRIEPGTPMTLLGSTASSSNTGAGLCGGASASDVVYEITRSESGDLDLFLDPSVTDYDAVLYARPLCGTNTNSVCDDQDDNGGELIELSVTGDNPLYAWVDGALGAEGNYALVLIP